MNSNVVYGSAMSCHNSGINGTTTPSTDYHHQGYHFGADLSSYYQPPPQSAPHPPTSDLAGLNGSTTAAATQHTALSSTTPPSSHYSPASTFHMPGTIPHPFGGGGESVPGGIISEPNGLSYTNLDLTNQNSYGSNPVPHSHYQRLSQFNTSSVPVQGGSGGLAGPPPSHSTTQCSSQLSTPSPMHSYTQSFREYGSTPPDSNGGGSTTAPTSTSTPGTGSNTSSNQSSSTNNSHHELMSPHSDCSLGRSSSGSSGGSSYPNYFDSNLLSRSRNGHPSMHLQNGGLSSPYVDPTVSHYNEMTCNQLNGNSYHHHHHLNHLTNHLQSSHHHTAPATGSTGGRNSSNSNTNLLTTAPVPQYKWMQVKRNIPKPGNIIFANLTLPPTHTPTL